MPSSSAMRDCGSANGSPRVNRFRWYATAATRAYAGVGASGMSIGLRCAAFTDQTAAILRSVRSLHFNHLAAASSVQGSPGWRSGAAGVAAVRSGSTFAALAGICGLQVGLQSGQERGEVLALDPPLGPATPGRQRHALAVVGG